MEIIFAYSLTFEKRIFPMPTSRVFLTLFPRKLARSFSLNLHIKTWEKRIPDYVIHMLTLLAKGCLRAHNTVNEERSGPDSSVGRALDSNLSVVDSNLGLARCIFLTLG